jgi:hypothetical protein
MISNITVRCARGLISSKIYEHKNRSTTRTRKGSFSMAFLHSIKRKYVQTSNQMIHQANIYRISYYYPAQYTKNI